MLLATKMLRGFMIARHVTPRLQLVSRQNRETSCGTSCTVACFYVLPQIAKRRSGDDDGDMPHVTELNHSNRSSGASMDLDTNLFPPDINTTTRNIEYLKISGEIADDAENCADDPENCADDGEIFAVNAENFTDDLESFNVVAPPADGRSSDISNTSTSQSNYVSDGPLSESETSALNDSFHSCDSKIGGSTPDLELIVTGASPPKESCGQLAPEEIPRTTSFFNKMIDTQGNLIPFSPKKRVERHSR